MEILNRINIKVSESVNIVHIEDCNKCQNEDGKDKILKLKSGIGRISTES